MKKMLLIALSLAPVSLFSHEAETEEVVVVEGQEAESLVAVLARVKKHLIACPDLLECGTEDAEVQKDLDFCSKAKLNSKEAIAEAIAALDELAATETVEA